MEAVNLSIKALNDSIPYVNSILSPPINDNNEEKKLYIKLILSEPNLY